MRPSRVCLNCYIIIIAMKEGFFQEETDTHVEDIRSGSTAMLVIVRLRPLTTRESAINPTATAQAMDGKVVSLLDPADEAERRGRSREAQFSFDFVYSEVSPILVSEQPTNRSTMKPFLACLKIYWKGTVQPSWPTEPQAAAKLTRRGLFTQHGG
jgi:hypothetical protein